MDLADRFQDIIDSEEVPTLDELDELYDSADAVEIDDVLGEWAGGIFGLGHPAEAQLQAIRWAGKSFAGPDDVAPIVCFDAAGERFVNHTFGGARLRMTDYRGSATATMIYDNLPVADHFRRVSDTILVGAMEAKGQERPGYFYLTRLATSVRPYDPKSPASQLH